MKMRLYLGIELSCLHIISIWWTCFSLFFKNPSSGS